MSEKIIGWTVVGGNPDPESDSGTASGIVRTSSRVVILIAVALVTGGLIAGAGLATASDASVFWTQAPPETVESDEMVELEVSGSVDGDGELCIVDGSGWGSTTIECQSVTNTFTESFWFDPKADLDLGPGDEAELYAEVDEAGWLGDSDETTVEPVLVNHPPSSWVDDPDSDVTVMEGETLEFTVAAHDQDGNLGGADWYVDGYEETTSLSGTEDTTSYQHTIDSEGTYTVAADVFDDEIEYNDQAATWTVTVVEPSGDLELTVLDEEDYSHPGTVVLYDEDWNKIDERMTDSGGDVSWSGLDEGTYRLEAYYDDDFWGSTTVEIDRGETTEDTLARSAPYVTEVGLHHDDDDVFVGDEVTISPGVEHREGFSVETQVTISIDDADFEKDRGPIEIDEGETGWYGANFVPDEPGEYCIRAEVEALYAQQFSPTDDTGWAECFTVEDTTGDFEVDVHHENGGQASEVNALNIWQDGEIVDEESVSNYPSVDLPHTFEDLPAGHDYLVNVYVHDQLAGTAYTTIEPGDDEFGQVEIEDPTYIEPVVYYNDGSTPLEGAEVVVESHEGVEWRSSVTEEDGYTEYEKLWLYPTNEGYYTVSVEYEGETVATKQLDDLDDPRTVALTTDVNIEDETGEFEVDVRHENDEQVSEVNALMIWRDGEHLEEKSVENHPGVNLPHTFENLPAGQYYHVNVYVNDQHAGSAGVTLDPNEEAVEHVEVEDPVYVEPVVYYNDGRTPLEGAEVVIESHEEREDPWRSSVTGEDGHTAHEKLWLHPTSEGYYTVSVKYEGETVATKQLDDLEESRTLDLTTDVTVEDETGEFEIDVRHENDEGVSEVNALMIWQDGDLMEHKSVEDYSGVDLPYTFEDLPAGSHYQVNVYVQDQLAGSAETTIDPDDETFERVDVDDPVYVEPIVYHDEGEWPLEGAEVVVESHEGIEWRSSVTEQDGHTEHEKLWLHPTNKGYYTVSVEYEGETVATKQLDDLDESRTLRLVTNVEHDGLPFDVVVPDDEVQVGAKLPLGVESVDDDATFEWTVVDGPDEDDEQILHNYEEYDQPTPAVTTFTPNEEGDYEIQVTVEEGGEVIGEELIEVEATDNRTFEVDGEELTKYELAEEYAPVVYYHSEERYTATRYEAYVENSKVRYPGIRYEVRNHRVTADHETVIEDPTLLDIGDPDSYPSSNSPDDPANELYLIGNESDFVEYQEDYPQTVHASVHEDVKFEDEEYTAITYWRFYLFDPKKDHDTVDGIKQSASAHPSDTETVTILLNEDGPQYVGAAQHFSGTYTEWEKVPREGSSLEIYSSKGAHATFFTNSNEFNSSIPGQNRWLPFSQSTSTAGFKPMDDVTEEGEEWNLNEDYDLVLLSDDMEWGNFAGFFESDEGGLYYEIRDGGTLPPQRDRWNQTGPWMEERMLHMEDDDVVDASTGTRFSLVSDPAIRGMITNDGVHPHTFYVKVEIKPAGGDWENDGIHIDTEEYSLGYGGRPGYEGQDVIEIPVEDIDLTEGDYEIRVSTYSYDPDEISLDDPVDAYTFEPLVADTIHAEIMDTANAETTDVTAASDEYGPGDDVTTTVDIENTGEEEHTFFVGYSAVDEDGEVYDNDGTTGEAVTIDAGQTESVKLSWTVPSNASEGEYDLVTAVWAESDRDALHTRLDENTREDAIEVTDPTAGDLVVNAYPEATADEEADIATTDTTSEEPTVRVDGTEYEVGDTIVLEEGTHVVTIEHEGYETEEHEVTIEAGEQTEVSTLLELADPDPPSAAIDAPDTAPMDEPVTLDASESSDPYGFPLAYEWGLTGDGKFVETNFSQVAAEFDEPGEYDVTIRVSTHHSTQDTATTTIEVHEGYNDLTVEVVDEHGEPVENDVTLAVLDADTDEAVHESVMSTGVETVEVLAGDYEVTAEADDYESNSGSVTVENDEHVTLALAAEPGSVAGTVSNDDGERIENATVTLTDADDGEVAEVTTNPDGEFAFDDVAAADGYEITAEAEGYESTSETTDVGPGGDVTVDLTLEADDDEVGGPPIIERPGFIITESTDLGEVAVGDSETKTIEVTNDGDAPLTIYEAWFEGPDADDFEVVGTPLRVPPGETRDFEVIVTPGASKDGAATLLFDSSYLGAHQPEVALSYTGTEPAALEIEGTNVDAIEVDVDEPVTVEAELVNDGGVAGERNVEFTVDGVVEETATVTLGPDDAETVSFTVTFEEAGTYELAVGDEPVASVEVTEERTPTVTPTLKSTPTPESDDEAVPGFGIPAALIALVAILSLTRRRILK